MDPDAAFDQWLYLREQMKQQRVSVANAFPLPRAQLQSDLKILQQVLASSGKLAPTVVAHQVEVLSEYASTWLTELEATLPRAD